MQTSIVTDPTVEPVTLGEAKMQLNLDSETLDGNLDIEQSMAIASHAIAADYTTHVGTGVEVLGSEAEVLVHAGTNGVGGTVDTKIQESDDGITYTDFTGGAFAQVTEANDNADYKIQYTGIKRYVRTVSQVLVAACTFGSCVIVSAATRPDDNLLTTYLKTARRHVEAITRRAVLTQTWDFFLPQWPSSNMFALPFGNLQSVTSVSWKDSDGDETTLTENTDYLVETNGLQHGKIVLPYSTPWPSGTLYPSKPIKVRFVCGWETAADVPEDIKAATLLIIGDLWENREGQTFGIAGSDYSENRTIMNLLWNSRLWNDFE